MDEQTRVVSFSGVVYYVTESGQRPALRLVRWVDTVSDQHGAFVLEDGYITLGDMPDRLTDKQIAGSLRVIQE